jgi:hypothetical protein
MRLWAIVAMLRLMRWNSPNLGQSSEATRQAKVLSTTRLRGRHLEASRLFERLTISIVHCPIVFSWPLSFRPA